MRTLARAFTLLTAITLSLLPIGTHRTRAAVTATLAVSPASSLVQVGQQLAVDVKLDSGGNAVGAVGLKINFTANLTYVGFDATGSVLDMQVGAPNAAGGVFTTSRAHSGAGFNGADGLIGRITFTVNATGLATLTFVEGVGDTEVVDTLSNQVLASVTDGNYNHISVGSLGSASLTNGSTGSDATPGPFTFTTANLAGGQVRFQIQIDDTANFSSPVIDYSSALAAAGASSFTVGQAAGTGTYNTGNAATTLSDSAYYWRVRALDSLDTATAYSTANGGAIAFRVDTAGPTQPSISSPTSGATVTTHTPAFTASAFSDAASTHAASQWLISTAANLSSPTVDTGDDVTNLTSYTSTTLPNGTYYVGVRYKDSTGNYSSYSSAVQFIVAVPTTYTDVTADATVNLATVTWTTSVATSTQLSYAPTTEYAEYGTVTDETDTGTRVTSHSVTLTGLLPCTTYFYLPSGTDAVAAESTASESSSFTTRGCPGDAAILSQASSYFDALTGGSLTIPSAYGSNGSFALTVPSGFAATDAGFQVKQLTSASATGTISTPTGRTVAGNQLYHLEALTDVDSKLTSFLTPLTLTIGYSEADATGLDAASLAVYRWDEADSTWGAVTGCTLDTTARTASCPVSQFSIYALTGTASSTATPTPTATPSATTTPAATLPQTGQAALPGILVGLLGAGASVAAYRRRRS